MLEVMYGEMDRANRGCVLERATSQEVKETEEVSVTEALHYGCIQKWYRQSSTKTEDHDNH